MRCSKNKVLHGATATNHFPDDGLEEGMRYDICEARFRMTTQAIHWILIEEALQDRGGLD